MPGRRYGASAYASPEVAEGVPGGESSADAWGVGVLAFELLTGVKPTSWEGVRDIVTAFLLGRRRWRMSEDALAFVAAAIVLKPRATIQELLQHRWIATCIAGRR